MASQWAASHGQEWRQVGELLCAFGLSSIIGLERQFRGKSAGLRTQAIVGTAAGLFLMVSKYGFGDVAANGTVNLDPSRVAAQVVSGIGFLGAGLIITRRGSVHGLTTAASVWETAAIGMAAAAGLPLLALLVTGLHFMTVIVFTPVGRVIADRAHAETLYTITYQDGSGVLRDLLARCAEKVWSVTSLSVLTTEPRVIADHVDADPVLVTVALAIAGSGTTTAIHTFGDIPGVLRVDRGAHDDE